MNTVTQITRRRQAIIEYSIKKGVTAAARRYNVSRQFIYRWKNRYDGTLESLKDRSHRPHSHPNQHTAEELKLIEDMRKRNMHTGLVVFWVKLRQKGYTRSITALWRILKKRNLTPVKPPNPKYVPKPYEKMLYPGQRVQIDVKFVPDVCIVGDAKAQGKKFYQYTAIDEYSRYRYVEAFEEHSSYSSAVFLEHMLKAFKFPVECVQTDNGQEFTKRLGSSANPTATLFEARLKQCGITSLLSHTHLVIMARLSVLTEKITSIFMLCIHFIRLMISKSSLLFTTGNTTISLCVLLIGRLLQIMLRLSYPTANFSEIFVTLH